MSALSRFLVVSAVLVVFAAPLPAEPPAISNIHPDFPVAARGWRSPQILTGENLDANGLEILCWSHRGNAEEVAAAAETLGTDDQPTIPAEPPEGAQRIQPVDVERQVLVAYLRGHAVWVRSPAGTSRPYAINLPKPFWLSHETVTPGQRMHCYGMAMERDHGGPRQYEPKPGAKIAFRQGERTWVVSTRRQARQTVWTADSRLVFFYTPGDLEPGRPATIYAHNGVGGEFGWVRCGQVDVVAANEAAPKIFAVTAFGATGDDLSADTAGLEKALAAAADHDGPGEAVVFLPPGLWRVKRTLSVPAGVTLRGASRDATILEGHGFGRHGGAIESVVQLAGQTTMEGLCVQGAVGEGSGGNALVSIAGDGDRRPENVNILDCRLRGYGENPAGTRDLYWGVLRWGQLKRLNLLRNDLYGSIWFHRGERLEIVGNTFHGGTFSINVSIHGWAYDSLLDDNQFVDTPGRVCFYPRRHTYIRFNEVHWAHRAAWANASEVYLVHGAYGQERKFVGTASGGGAAGLADSTQRWPADGLKDTVVVLVGGRGFGQYRTVTANTATELTVDRPWRVPPDETTEYVVSPLYLESAFYNNLNDTPMVMSLWLDCLGLVVDRHRDRFSSGVQLWGSKGEGAKDFLPSWYNVVSNSWLFGSQIKMVVGSKGAPRVSGPPSFGAIFVGNRIRFPHMAGHGKDIAVHATGGVKVGGLPRAGRPIRNDKLAAGHTIIAHNFFADTPLGVAVGPAARKTLILGNTFERVDTPMLDWGARTRFLNNTRWVLDANGQRDVPLENVTSSREMDIPRPLVLRGFEALEGPAGGARATLRVPLSNDGNQAVTCNLSWAGPRRGKTHWTVTPGRTDVKLEPGQSRTVSFAFKLTAGLGDARPLPELTVQRRPAAGGEPTTRRRRPVLDFHALLAVLQTRATVPKTDTAPTLDGNLEEGAWKRAAVLDRFVDPEGGGDVKDPTEVRLIHDGKTLYVGIRCHEGHPPSLRARTQKRDGPVWQDDSIELFFDADRDAGDYRQLLANPLGTRFDIDSDNRDWDGDWRVAAGGLRPVPGPADPAGEKASGKKQAWTLEFAIPLETLGLAYKPGAAMGFNAVRFQPPRDRSMWSPVFSNSNHVPSRFGTLVLE